MMSTNDFELGEAIEKVNEEINELSAFFDHLIGIMDEKAYFIIAFTMIQLLQSNDINKIKCALVVTKGIKKYPEIEQERLALVEHLAYLLNEPVI